MIDKKFIKVTVPSENCPRGRILEVFNIHKDDTVYGMRVDNDNDWTRYYIQKGEYEFIEYNQDN